MRGLMALWQAYTAHDHSGSREKGRTLNGLVASGMVFLWSGSVATIPAGYQLCNGTNGTPDLRNRFIMGAAEGGQGIAFGVDTHNFSHAHSISASTGAAGNHGHVTQTPDEHGTTRAEWATTTNRSGPSVENHPHAAASSTSDPDHVHSVAGASTDAQLGAQENRPPFYALAYIQKL